MTTKQRWLAWLDARFPLSALCRQHLTRYAVPKNLNFWYAFGVVLLFVLLLQFVSGLFLTLHYQPNADRVPGTAYSWAFASVEHIMRDVPAGWILRYMHTTGASLLFVALYLHLFRGLLYGSYKRPRELVWLWGMLLFFGLMAEAFLGYLLPWGQMSYWGAQVITTLLSNIPLIGPPLALLVRGDYLVSGATLNRFFAWHVIAMPFLLLLVGWLHVKSLHHVGANNPDGIELSRTLDPLADKPLACIPFHPYYTVKDLLALVIFLIIFCAIVFFAPAMGGYFIEANNFIPANPMITPASIEPLWYFAPFYAMLRAVPAWFGSTAPGVLLMLASLWLLLALPWLDRSPIRSIRYRPGRYKWLLGAWVAAVVALGVLGRLPPDPLRILLSRVFTVVYFAYFIVLPWLTRHEQPVRPYPEHLSLSDTRARLYTLAWWLVFILAVGLFARLI